MTPLFVREFEKENKCKNCRIRRLAGHTVCADHLRRARERFASWCKVRNAAGICIACNRKGYKVADHVELRCIVHKNINKRRCLAWSVRRSELVKKTGLCYRHKNPVVSGQLCPRCQREDKLHRQELKERRNGTA